MKRTTMKYIGILLVLVTIFQTGCKDDRDPIIEELETSRTFAPVGLVAFVRGQISVELNWTAESEVDQYIVEIYQDSLLFQGDPVAVATIDDFPVVGTVVYTAELEGDTQYSARVRAVQEGKEESNWAELAVRTDPEQIFSPDIPGVNFQDTFATLLWEPGSDVTNFLVQPGNLFIPITAAQRAAGEATISGLLGGRDYTVTLYNGTKRRGTLNFSTLKQANVTALDDLSAVIDAAAEGDTLVLAEGTYNLGGKVVTKSIVIEGQKSYDRPIILGQLACESAVASISLDNLIFDGENNTGQFFNAGAATCDLGELIVNECEIRNYDNNIIYNNSGGTYGDITITNSYIHDIDGGGGDGFDIRGGVLGSLTVENTTITNGIRTMLRMQVPADVAFRNVTFFRTCIVASSNNRGFFRMSGGGGTLEVSNCLLVETGVDDNGTLRGVWSRDGDISEEVSTTFASNYFFNVIGLFDGDQTGFTLPSQAGATEADPEFEDPENGDFSLGNQLLIDLQIGDPQWWN